MHRGVLARLILVPVVCAIAIHAYAQGAGASISGLVRDSNGGVIPGATVQITAVETNVSFTTPTNTAGVFNAPGLPAGVYDVSVSLSGFRTYVNNGLRLTLGAPINLEVVLDVGQLTETVQVEGGGTQLVNTLSPVISSTVSVDEISKLPLSTRNVLNFVTLLPGVETTGVARTTTSINGLPMSSVNITLDGVNIQDNPSRSIEFLAWVYPRQDAIEEVTVTSATQGADLAGQGAVQIRFTTRSGTNRYQASIYQYYRHPNFNTNYWFNKNRDGLPRQRIILNQYGGRIGGPLVIPGLYNGRGKSFFFFNYEEFNNPREFARTRTLFHPSAGSGIYRYEVVSGGTTQIREVNLLSLAAARGFPSTVDPDVRGILERIRTAVSQDGAGTLTDLPNPNQQRFVFLSAGERVEHHPTLRLDFNLGSSHRLTGTYTWVAQRVDPDFIPSAVDSPFPGFPYGTSGSDRISGTVSLRSTLAASLVNEFRIGGTGGETYFGNVTRDTFGIQGGYNLVLGSGLTNPIPNSTPSQNRNPNLNIANTLNYQRGTHSMSFGGEFTRFYTRSNTESLVPTINFGLSDADPANALFTRTLIPDASDAQLAAAEAMYSTLIGSVTSINGVARLNEATGMYEYLGPLKLRAHIDEIGIFGQDSWRVTPTLTVNAGLRWEYQLPFKPENGVMSRGTFADLCGISGIGADGNCNLFQPGTLTGIRPMFVQYEPNEPGYGKDKNNFAPNLGVAWRPVVEGGWLRTLLGDPEQATIRAGYSVSFVNSGINNIYSGNPGTTVTTNRNQTNGNILRPGETWPLLYSDRSRLGPPETCAPGVAAASCIQQTPSLPIAATTAQNMNIVDPNIQMASARSYSVGLQRALSQNMAVEVRYVGTRSLGNWAAENYNEINLLENGFFDEFGLAMANLQSHVAQGCGLGGAPACSFAYRGPGTGTSPLPIHLAYLSGLPRAQAGNASAYSAAQWTTGTILANFALQNPNPAAAAAALHNDATRRAQAITAGLPENFFVLNPNVTAANITKSNGYSRYNSLQVELRRRFSDGLQANVNYTYGNRWVSSFLGQHYGYRLQRSAGNPHGVHAAWNYEVPVGKGRRFGSGMGAIADGILGGWSISGTGRWQTRQINLGSVRLVGMSLDELQNAYAIRVNPDTKVVTMLPDDIILNTRRAYSVSATTANGYSTALGAPEGRYIAPANSSSCITLRLGDCAPDQTLLNAPPFTRVDLSFQKKFRIGKRATFDFTVDVLNVFDSVNFLPVANPGAAATIFEVTAAYTDPTNTFDPGGRLGQLIWRFTW